MKMLAIALLISGFLAPAILRAADGELMSRVQHGVADSNGVEIHYASLGEGPLVVMIHGFPDFWYTWRHQMQALADAGFRAVAIDQRGYNKSGQPKGVENYDMSLLVGDVAAVIQSLGQPKATIVGHDWGGMVAWQFALNLPQMTENLIILNLPHPNGFTRELATNERQIKNSEYARNFQKEGFHENLTAQGLAAWVKDPEARELYVEAFERSDFEAMLNYYKRNYPSDSAEERWAAIQKDPGPRAQMPILMFHGLADTALDRMALNDTWEWVDKDLTLVTVPGASHFVQQDAADLVSETLVWWLKARQD